MVTVVPSSAFKKAVKHCDPNLRERIEKLVKKILADPDVGKPLKYARGERAVRTPPFRLVYAYSAHEDTLFLLKLDNRDAVYGR